MKRSSRSLHRMLCHTILLVLSIVFGLYLVAEAETVAELEKKVQDCQKAVAWALAMYDSNECDRTLRIPVQDDPEVKALAQKKNEAVKSLDVLESQIDTLNRQIESLEVRCDADHRAGDVFSSACTELSNKRSERKRKMSDYPIAMDYQRLSGLVYQSAVKRASNLREDCKVLKKQIADGESNCKAIDQRLQAARAMPPTPPPPSQPKPQQQQTAYPGTPNAFDLLCNPTQVQVDGIVNCTAYGVFGSDYKNRIDLTSDPDTVWRNGPRVSAKGLKPGQTFVVTATKGNASKSVTITVAGGKQGTTGKTIKLGFINYQKISGFTVTVNGTTKTCSPGSSGASWSNMPTPTQSQGAADCVFEVPAGTCNIRAQASGYQTEAFDHKCDKNETVQITMIKSR